MKKLIFVIILVLFTSGFYFAGAMAKVESEPMPIKKASISDRKIVTLGLPEQKIPRFLRIKHIELDASSVFLMNANTGQVLFEKNSDTSLPTASMSKMMTELLVLEAIDEQHLSWDTNVSISDYAYAISSQPGFASVQLEKGNSYTVKALFEAMAVHSANGAAIALAEAVATTEEKFVKQMNQKAEDLDLKDSRFVNSSGLDNAHLGKYYSVGEFEDTNTMSAQDLAKLAEHLITEYPELLGTINEKQYVRNNKSYPNTNWMLPNVSAYGLAYEGVDGLKTGYTDQAGYGFTGTVERNGIRLISVVMGTSSKMERFEETEKLYDASFELY
ncbi:D-alanyl-D-alanine carboxypeptidase family protein [Gracilibacillus kekensis]|uniref:D-alanyl-D-alanine carboxypeptidase (Penicillin-binding protein 5/6) n=1 Tax=Gracilibacillus kekensis TaxID=1027249 RepID=A0A1M7QBA9_9BACI|nr:D-alanyl-D-alanine carboxypeptidase family protein [Gracilibacillus kekensis]SHN27694.1 D-alanyl-D-alanine carboxypeptidase (penicillin-binding protein 5/6) [Gracilibacillus kekensis]